MQEKINLSNVGGEGNLASALGLGTNAVGGLWKQLRRVDEPSRAHHLDRLAASLAEDLSKFGGAVPTDAKVQQVARQYGISPDAVAPLLNYHAARNGSKQTELQKPLYFFSL